VNQEQENVQQVDSDAAFAAGFNEARGVETPTPAPEAAKTTEEQAPEPPKEDGATSTEPPKGEWEGVSPKVKAEFESITEKLKGFDTISRQLATVNAHIGGLKSQQQEMKAALAGARAAAVSEGKDAPTTEQVERARTDSARWKQLKEDFPEWAEAVDERLADLQRSLPREAPVNPADLEAQIAKRVEERIQTSTQAARDEARVLAVIDAKHDGWEETINTPEFAAWYRTQPAEIQRLSASPKAKDAIRMLDLYAEHTKKQAQKAERDKRLDRAITPSGSTATAVVEDPEAAFDAGFRSVRG